MVGDLIDFDKGTLAVDEGSQRMPWSDITMHYDVTTGWDRPNVEIINLMNE
jgi:hypothetical protein